jgi:hypothetical protein
MLEKIAFAFVWFILIMHPSTHVSSANYIAHQLGATQTFSGVRAHHQAGITERAIGMITSWARTMMLHSIIYIGLILPN